LDIQLKGFAILLVILFVHIHFSANNFAMQHKRKTISGPDVLDAMKEMEFERFVEPLKKSLECKKLFQKLLIMIGFILYLL